MAIRIIKTKWVRFLYIPYCLDNSYDSRETSSYCLKEKTPSYTLCEGGIEAWVGSLVTLTGSTELDAEISCCC